MPINRSAAAALTVAFELRKADHLSRGEKPSDDLIAQEVQKVFLDMMALTDPLSGIARAQARVAKAAKTNTTP